MKLTYNWLSDHIDTNLSPKEIGDRLTAIGHELESIKDFHDTHKDFVVAKIKKVSKHPDADRLNICTVDDGKDIYQVICGAPNVKEGMKSIFSREGLIIPATGDVLKKGKIRGVESQGMLLSERELCISDDHEGIIEVSDHFKIGDSCLEALNLSDVIYEINITPNRGDCLGVRGLARDLSAAGCGKLKDLTYMNSMEIYGECPEIWRIENDQNACRQVYSRHFKNVSNSKSPDWMQQRLKQIGLRPINCLVDITNYITFDCGRPLHVFDCSKISLPLSMRRAKSGETIKALDNKEYELDINDTVIADKNSIHGIGGIIGGDDSGCNESTTEVILEVAEFEKDNIAKTGRKLGVMSDARQRFERGIDPLFLEEGLNYATYLIQKYCGGQASEVYKLEQNKPEVKKIIEYQFDKIEKIIGIKTDPNIQQDYLNHLGFEITNINDVSCSIISPSWRHDIERDIDIVEEVIRLHGYEKIPFKEIETKPLFDHDLSSSNKKYKVIDRLKRFTASHGFHEVISFSFHSEKIHKAFHGSECLKLANPINENSAFMRNTMIGNHLQFIEDNKKFGHSKFDLFEIGPIYNSFDEQQNILSCLVSNVTFENSVYKRKNIDFYHTQNFVNSLIKFLNFDFKLMTLKRSNINYFHPGKSAELFLGKKLIARYGEIHPNISKQFTKHKNIYCVELYFENLPIEATFRKQKKSLFSSEFQFSDKDFSFVVDDSQNLQEIYQYLRSIDKKLIQQIEFYDSFVSENLGLNKKSFTFRVRIQSSDKTLSEEDLNTLHNKIIDNLKEKFNAVLRS